MSDFSREWHTLIECNSIESVRRRASMAFDADVDGPVPPLLPDRVAIEGNCDYIAGMVSEDE